MKSHIMSSAAPALARFYPIVPDTAWLKRIVPLGVKTVQLRIKGEGDAKIRDEIVAAIAITRQHGCQLIVNDYWQAALAAGADFIHLGQEDLASADLAAIRRAGARLGISTHDEAERAIALAAKPDYVALGPIFETKLKVMPWAPQGLARLHDWKQSIGQIPLVAIGGLTPERAASVRDAGADSLAVITDFVTAQDPEARVREWLSTVSRMP